MTDAGDTPDEPSGSEPFEQGDEAIDESTRLDPDFVEEMEQDPSIDPTLVVDGRELEEADSELDDPESFAVLEGGIDDPDGLGGPGPSARARRTDDEGWDLDAPVTGAGVLDDDEAEGDGP